MGLALALCPVSVGVGGGKKKKLHVQDEQASARPKAILPGSLGGASCSIICPELLVFSSFPSVDPVLPLSLAQHLGVTRLVSSSLASMPGSPGRLWIDQGSRRKQLREELLAQGPVTPFAGTDPSGPFPASVLKRQPESF